MTSAHDNPIRPMILMAQETCKRDHAFVRHLLQGLAYQDVPAFWVACNFSGRFDPALEELAPGVSFPEIDLPLMQPLNVRRLLMYLEPFGPSLLHCLGEDVLPLAYTLAASLEVNVLVNVNRLQTRRNQLTISNRRCRVLTAPCASIRVSIERWHQRYADRVQEVTPWIERSTPRRNGFACGKIPSLIVAADHASRRELYFWLSCFQALQREGLTFIVAMLVESDQETHIRTWLHELGLDEIVTLLSEDHVWHDVVAAGDAFIVPAPMERYDPRLLEAMSRGLTVIACPGGLDDWLVQDQTAWLVHAGNKPECLAALQRLLEHPDQARALAETCREHILQTLPGSSESVEGWMGLYQMMTTSRSGLEAVG